MEIFTNSVAHIKRFLEIWAADLNFRNSLANNEEISEELKDHLVNVSPHTINIFKTAKNINSFFNALDINKLNAEVKEYIQFREYKKQLLHKYKFELQPANLLVKNWRSVHISRSSVDFSNNLDSAIIHPTFAIELSNGCSIGCWFCGVSATKLSNNYLINDNNDEFEKILEALKKYVGATSGQNGFLYWATDPFDNPNYVEFCKTFKKVFGSFPHTTTAQPLKYLKEIKYLLEASNEEPFFMRFSVLSLAHLKKIHQEFSAEELAYVEIISQNKESLVKLANVGKARNINNGDPNNNSQTIACISGFLINIVNKTIKLISPCNSSDQWPLGYYIYSEDNFVDAEDFERKLQCIIDDNMSFDLDSFATIKFNNNIKLLNTDKGIELYNDDIKFSFNGYAYKEIANLINSNDFNLQQLNERFSNDSLIEKDTISRSVKIFLEKGLLNIEPSNFLR